MSTATTTPAWDGFLLLITGLTAFVALAMLIQMLGAVIA